MMINLSHDVATAAELAQARKEMAQFAEFELANTAGYEAGAERKRQSSNPHPADSKLYNAWDAGWLQAAADDLGD